MNEQNSSPTSEETAGSSASKPVANFQAYGNSGVMFEDGSSALTSSESDEGSSGSAQAFMSALQTMEKDRNVNAMVEQFSSSCQVWRQSSGHAYVGAPGTQDFWNEYLNQFQSIETEFTRVTERDDLAILEWESRGALQGGRPIHYRGVSILEFGDDAKVETFKTYFDSAHFISIHATS